MRIGLIAPPWVPIPPSAYGGTEEVVDLLARGLTAGGHDVTLFTTGDATCPVRTRWVYATPPTPMGQTVPEAHHLVAAYEALRDEVDVIHDHTTLGALVSHLASDVPVVLTNHGPFTDATRRIYAAARGRVDMVAISRSQAASAGERVPISAVIHHGIDLDRTPVGDGSGGFALFLGRMSPTKGVHLAIEAAQRAGVPIKLAAKCREALEQQYFDEVVRPRLGDDVEFLGEVGEADKLDLLGRAIALVNPIQWSEPFGLVMIEALGCGTPVITTRFGAAPEIVRDRVNGRLCDDVAAMVDALRTIDEIDRGSCRAVAEQHFGARRMVEEHEALYVGVVSRRTANDGGR